MPPLLRTAPTPRLSRHGFSRVLATRPNTLLEQHAAGEALGKSAPPEAWATLPGQYHAAGALDKSVPYVLTTALLGQHAAAEALEKSAPKALTTALPGQHGALDVSPRCCLTRGKPRGEPRSIYFRCEPNVKRLYCWHLNCPTWSRIQTDLL